MELGDVADGAISDDEVGATRGVGTVFVVLNDGLCAYTPADVVEEIVLRVVLDPSSHAPDVSAVDSLELADMKVLLPPVQLMDDPVSVDMAGVARD